MRALATIFEVLTVLGAIVGALAVIWAVRSLGIGGANDITLAASSAFAVAVTALPYCAGGAIHRYVMRDIAELRIPD